MHSHVGDNSLISLFFFSEARDRVGKSTVKIGLRGGGPPNYACETAFLSVASTYSTNLSVTEKYAIGPP
jgi:hypothetical protein